MNKGISIIIKIILIGISVALAYYIIAGILKPIRLEHESEKRLSLTKQRLKDIRTAQVAFKEKNGVYTPSFDELIKFLTTDSMRLVKVSGDIPDSLTEVQAIKLGLFSRDTSYIFVKDTLFKDLHYVLDSIRYVPVGTKVKFVMDTATIISSSTVPVKVFQAYALYEDILFGMDRQYIINFKAKEKEIRKDSTLRVGSITEINNNAGNWGE